MYQVHNRVGSTVVLVMLNICGFSFINATPRDKCAHLGLLRKDIHLLPMEVLAH